jgi:fatty-acyl-CoA synthase
MLRFVAGTLRSGPSGRFTAADLIERSARRRPKATFVRFEGRQRTYAEYNAAANRIAHWAIGRGLGKGDVVALMMQNRPEYLEAWAGLAKVGATTALINTNLTGQALVHALDAAGAGLLILGAECAPAWAELGPDTPDHVQVYILRDPGRAGSSVLPGPARSLDEAIAGYSIDNPPRAVRAGLQAGDDLFYIYTSGTTGLPKAAHFSHSRFMGGGIYALLSGFGRNDTLYCALPLYHTVGGVMCVNAVLRSGGTLALKRRFSASSFWRDVVDMRATAFQYIGEFCRYLLNQPQHPMERQHQIRFCVGNGLRPDIWPEFQQRFRIPHIVEFYGATEANVSLMNLDDRVGSCGRLAPGMSAKLIRYDVESDAHLRDSLGHCIECAPDEPGELIGRISSGRTAAGRFEGYTSEEASSKKILRDVFEAGDAWFRSGDLLHRDADGYFYFVDRIGDTFRWKGENVSTQEVAEAITACDEVELAAVYGVELPGSDGRAGMASVVLSSGAKLDGKELYAHLSEALPAYARPAFVRVQDEPELTGTLKLRKVELQREGFDPARVGGDALYYRDDTSRTFRPLTPADHGRVLAGEIRF